MGIAASGTTPYVIGALNECRKREIITGSISCNPDSPVSAAADFPIEVVVGPEFITGSTRMKSGTAQKLVLNMISTSVMIQLGRVEDNKMVNMQLTNEKLVDRGVKMLMERLQLTDYEKTKQLLLQYGSVKKQQNLLEIVLILAIPLYIASLFTTVVVNNIHIISSSSAMNPIAHTIYYLQQLQRSRKGIV